MRGPDLIDYDSTPHTRINNILQDSGAILAVAKALRAAAGGLDDIDIEGIADAISRLSLSVEAHCFSLLPCEYDTEAELLQKIENAKAIVTRAKNLAEIQRQHHDCKA